MVIGASLRAPIWRNHWVSADIDYWRDEYWVQAPPAGTPYEVRVVPVGMLTTGLSAGRRERFGSLFFVDGGLSVELEPGLRGDAVRLRALGHEVAQAGSPHGFGVGQVIVRHDDAWVGG